MVIPLERDDSTGVAHFFAAGPHVVVNHDVKDGSPIRGIPMELISPPQCPDSLPSVGVVWRQTAPAMSLVPYAILCRCSLDMHALASICRAYNIRVIRASGAKSISKEAYMRAVLKHFFL